MSEARDLGEASYADYLARERTSGIELPVDEICIDPRHL
jgi:hypothetical protein